MKPDFFKDEYLSELPFEARLLFAGLWCYADKSGRLEDRPKYLKAEIFPYNDVDIEKLLDLLANPKISDNPSKFFIRRYIVHGRHYIDIPTFLEHQNPHHTEKESKIPEFNGYLTVKDSLKKEDTVPCSLFLVPCSFHSNETVKDSFKKEDFDIFYREYPKHKGRKDAFTVWMKLKPSNELLQTILKAITIQKQSKEWNKNNGEYIPLPATWLNANRWEDEVEENKKWNEA